ncbi:MAG TPA: hypothetical protein VFA90_13495 [Terriglobales bacterium]|nr:hypothetical protein [Terriglobales bacterium]
MSLRTQIVRVAAFCALFLIAAADLSAQVRNSAAQPIALNAVLSDSVSVNLSANAVNFSLTPGNANNPGSTAITATTTWLLKPNIGFVSTYAFFSSSASALSDGVGDNIPSADFQISDNGAALKALNTTVPFGGANAGLRLSSTLILGNNKKGSHNDVMTFNINLSTIPSLPPNTYTGILTIQAQAF